MMGPLGKEGNRKDELVEGVLICMLFLHHICMLFMYCLEYSPGRFPRAQSPLPPSLRCWGPGALVGKKGAGLPSTTALAGQGLQG